MKSKSTSNKIEIIIEKNDGLLWGRVESRGNFMPTPYGEHTEQVVENLKALIKDYVSHEGKKDVYWSKIDLDNIRIEFAYDLQAFFQEHDYLKISSVAEQAGLNPGLVRQYASGVKYPSAAQANKIRNAVKKIARQLLGDSIYTA
ncbi:MAG: hypothetical protein ACHQD7_06380 [Chitinophagales bacterium]